MAEVTHTLDDAAAAFARLTDHARRHVLVDLQNAVDTYLDQHKHDEEDDPITDCAYKFLAGLRTYAAERAR